MHGLCRKLIDPDFHEFIQSHDIILLCETWLSPNTITNLDIDGYFSSHIFGNKSKNTRKGRYSGGISVYIKHELMKQVTVVEKQQHGTIWLKLSSAMFSFQDDVYLCHAYFPPANSNVFDVRQVDFHELLESDIIKYNNLGRVLVTGDLNSRTSNESDFIVFDRYIDRDIHYVNTPDPPARVNKDK